jgi:hypothetical protein
MRINTPLNDNDYRELKKESKEVLGASGYLTPPFGQSTNDYVEVHLLDTDGNFLEKFNSDHTTFEDDTIILNIGQDLRDRDYNRGEFSVRYNFIRKVAGGEEIVLTKTVNGQPNIIHSGNPELTGVAMGQFYTDNEGNAFVGENPPANGQDAQPLDIKEWKFKIDEISPSRTEVRIVPQLINNINYIKEFRDLIEPKRYIPETAWDEYIDGYTDLKNAWTTIRDNPNNGLSKWWRPRLQFEDNVTKKSDFGKLHWDLFGQNETSRNLPTQDGGGQISWTGPDSSRLEFNVRREVEDEGFKDYMVGSTITIKKAYIVGYETRPDIQENEDYQAEGGIPDLYIQATRVGDTREYNYSMYTMDGNVYDPNSQGVQFYWEFGCGHKQEASPEPNASHNYDTEGAYTPSVYVFTPNFQKEITEIRTPSGRVLDSVVTTPPPGTSSIGQGQFDGRIIKWNSNGETPIRSLTSQIEATTNTRWYIQNGYRRLITIDDALNYLRESLGQVLVEGEFTPSDVPLPSTMINQIPIGPDLNLQSFTQGISTAVSLPTEDMGDFDNQVYDPPVFLGNFGEQEEEEETTEPNDVTLTINTFFQDSEGTSDLPNEIVNSQGQTIVDVNIKVNGATYEQNQFTQSFPPGTNLTLEIVNDSEGDQENDFGFVNWGTPNDDFTTNPREITLNSNRTFDVRVGLAV